jgi:hypothetical protein
MKRAKAVSPHRAYGPGLGDRASSADRFLPGAAPKELVAKRLITMKVRKMQFRPNIAPKRGWFFPSLTGPQVQLVARNGRGLLERSAQ